MDYQIFYLNGINYKRFYPSSKMSREQFKENYGELNQLYMDLKDLNGILSVIS